MNVSDMPKRFLDLSAAVLLLLFFSPWFVLLAIAIKIDSKGPVFFTQDRRGLDFKTFRLIKFRTLRHNAPDPHDHYEMLEHDPRITRVGAFLRKTSLDELPQLINVLLGSMSLVGPRPLVEWESQKSAVHYSERFTVKPGITGLSQLNGRNSIDFDARCERDVEYVRHQSLLLDLILLLKTPIYLVKTSLVYPASEEPATESRLHS